MVKRSLNYDEKVCFGSVLAIINYQGAKATQNDCIYTINIFGKEDLAILILSVIVPLFAKKHFYIPDR